MASAERDLQKDLVNVELSLKEGWLKRELDELKLSENHKNFGVASLWDDLIIVGV